MLDSDISVDIAGDDALKAKIEFQRILEEVISQESKAEQYEIDLETCTQNFEAAKSERLASTQNLIDAELKESKHTRIMEDAEFDFHTTQERMNSAAKNHMEQLDILGKIEDEYKQKDEVCMESDRVADVARQRCRRSKELHEAARVSAATLSRSAVRLAEPVQAFVQEFRQLDSDAAKWEAQALEIRSKLSSLVDEEFEVHEQYKQLERQVPQLALQRDQVIPWQLSIPPRALCAPSIGPGSSHWLRRAMFLCHGVEPG